ncbi:MAG: VapE domain-containing protein [Terricaulis sp.]
MATETRAWPDVTTAGKPRATYPNARMALQSCEVEFTFDRFADRALVRGAPIANTTDGITDKIVSILRQHILERHGFDPGKENVCDAALQLCHEHSFDPVQDYLGRLIWDGRPRLETWLSRYVGAEDTPLHQAFGATALIAAVRRARQPGCKFDNVLVLEGLNQGEGKSSLLRILAGQEALFTDQEVLHLNVREQQEAIAGKWIVELSELAGISRGEVERIKAFVSRTHDRARPAYGRITVDQPRRCVFIGTTNQSQYLRDATGNRRFWPVRVGAIDLAAMREDRDQLWAEAAVREAEGCSLALPQALWTTAAEAQSARMEDDPWLENLAILRGDVIEGEERIAFAKVVSVLGIATERQSTVVAKRIGDCMLRLGWAKPEKPFKLHGKSTRGYTRPVRDVTAM